MADTSQYTSTQQSLYCEWTAIGLFLLIFILLVQLVIAEKVLICILLVTAFELRTSGVGSHRSSNCAKANEVFLELTFRSGRHQFGSVYFLSSCLGG